MIQSAQFSNPEPLVSVLMPVHNNERTVAESIESILNQDYKNIEFIILNDGSTDNTCQVIKSYLNDSRIKLFDFNENLGLTKRLNQGIDLCIGKYIARMDGDDVSLPTRIKKQVAFLEKNPDYLLVGSAYYLEVDGQFKGLRKQITSYKGLKTKLMFGNNISHPTVIFNKDLLLHSGLRYNDDLLYTQDYDLWTRALPLYKLANLEEPLLIYRGPSYRGLVKSQLSKDLFLKSRILFISKILKVGINSADLLAIFFKWPERMSFFNLVKAWIFSFKGFFLMTKIDFLQYFLRINQSLLIGLKVIKK